MIQLAGQFAPVKVNGETAEGRKLVQKYSVNGFPAILFINRKGEVIHTIGGYLPPRDFAAQMRQAAKLHKAQPK